jgi:hypothetical protein
MPQVPCRHVATGAACPLQPLVRPVDLRLGSAGGVARGARLAVEQHVVAGWFWGLEGKRLRHGARRSSTGARKHSRAAAPVPEQIGAGSRTTGIRGSFTDCCVETRHGLRTAWEQATNLCATNQQLHD